MSDEKVYLLQNESAGYVGNSPVFWRAGSYGYTHLVDDAERFTEVEASAIIHRTSGSHRLRRWRLVDVMMSTIRVVDIDLLRETVERRAEVQLTTDPTGA